MQLTKAAAQIGQVSSTFRMAQFGAAVLRFIAAVHALSLQVFFRYDLGCRYASKGNLFFSVLLIGFYSGLGGWIISALHHERISVLMEVLYTASICMCVWHRVSIYLKRRRGIIMFTRYSGTSYFERLLGFTGISEEVVKQYVEPAGVLFLAYLASCIHESTVSTWLLIGGVSIWLQEMLSAQMAEDALLDDYDNRMEAAYRREAMAGKAAKRQGCSISKSSVELMHLMAEQEPELSPEVKAMLDPQAVTA